VDNALIFNADPFVDLTYMNNINWQKKAFTVLYLVFIMTGRSLSQSIGAAGNNPKKFKNTAIRDYRHSDI